MPKIPDDHEETNSSCCEDSYGEGQWHGAMRGLKELEVSPQPQPARNGPSVL